MGHSSRILFLGAAGFLSFVITSCAYRTEEPDLTDSSQAAGVTFSVTAMPWNAVSGSLRPDFTITGDSAAQQVLAITEQSVRSSTDSVSTSLGVSGTFGGGGAVTAPSAPTGQTPSTTVLALPAAPAIGIDPILRTRAAYSYFQFVKLLNADLTSSILTSQYVPYVVRIKLGVLPYRDRVPYDLYAMVDFTVTGDTKNPGLVVVPLLSTDDVERASSAASAQNIRQLALAASALVPYVGASANIDHLSQLSESVAGQSYNSLLTIGRVTDNEMVARIGAAYQVLPDPSWLEQHFKSTDSLAGRALIGQTYDIFTIVLVERNQFEAKKVGSDKVALTINVNTSLKNAKDGHVLTNVTDNVLGKLNGGFLTAKTVLPYVDSLPDLIREDQMVVVTDDSGGGLTAQVSARVSTIPGAFYAILNVPPVQAKGDATAKPFKLQSTRTVFDPSAGTLQFKFPAIGSVAKMDGNLSLEITPYDCAKADEENIVLSKDKFEQLKNITSAIPTNESSKNTRKTGTVELQRQLNTLNTSIQNAKDTASKITATAPPQTYICPSTLGNTTTTGVTMSSVVYIAKKADPPAPTPIAVQSGNTYVVAKPEPRLVPLTVTWPKDTKATVMEFTVGEGTLVQTSAGTLASDKVTIDSKTSSLKLGLINLSVEKDLVISWNALDKAGGTSIAKDKLTLRVVEK